MDLPRAKRARTCSRSSLTFLPRSWWEYLDSAKEARALVNQITGKRSSPGMRVLLNFIDQFIQETFGRWKFSHSTDIVDYVILRFREELEAILDAIERRNALKGKVPIFGLGAPTS